MASADGDDYDPLEMAERFRAVFFGTPEIAVPALRALGEIAEVVGVVCQPDRPSGRGMKLRAPAVKSAALSLGYEVYQPTRVRSGELEQWLRARNPDVALVMAYGRILPSGVLTAPARGCLNLHASLLPRHRGAAPIQWALIHGDRETGISLMQMDEGLDTGPVLAERRLEILPEETAGELAARLAALAAVTTRLDVPQVMAGTLTPTPQDDARATHAPPLTRQDGILDWSQPAELLARRVRGLSPRPGAQTFLERSGAKPLLLRILRARAVADGETVPAGRVLIRSGRILVGTGAGLFELLEGQLEGRKALSARDLVNGRALREDDFLRGEVPTESSAPDHG